MPVKILGSPSHPYLNDPENARTRNVKPVTLTTTSPLICDEAMICVQSFANATGLPLDCVVSEAILYWWDTNGGDFVSQLERCHIN